MARAICRSLSAYCIGPQVARHHFLVMGSLKPDSCSTCLRNTDGLISRELQISKMLRREGLVLPNSMRLINARSYPDLAPSASWLIFNRNRRFRSSCPNATEGSRFGLFFAEDATTQCGTASILRAAYNTCGRRQRGYIAQILAFMKRLCLCPEGLRSEIP